MDEWYKIYYSTHYADSVRSLLTLERTQAEVAFILRETGLKSPARVADVACGEGRHSLILAERGFEVMGIDQNTEFIATAQQKALPYQSKARFVVHDMREAIGGPYQMVLSLYHSFGFFSDEDNRRVIHEWGQRLDPGGYFVLDIWNRERILRNSEQERTWQANSDLKVREEFSFNPLTNRTKIHYTYTYTEQPPYEYEANHRLYRLDEIRELMQGEKLEIYLITGSMTGEPFTNEARRLVVFAKKTV